MSEEERLNKVIEEAEKWLRLNEKVLLEPIMAKIRQKKYYEENKISQIEKIKSGLEAKGYKTEYKYNDGFVHNHKREIHEKTPEDLIILKKKND